MLQIGEVARRLRESKGLTQLAAAELLAISNVHLSNVENGKARPSADLLARYRDVWGIDLYVVAWCMSGDVEQLPASVREAGRALTDAWRQMLGGIVVPEHR